MNMAFMLFLLVCLVSSSLDARRARREPTVAITATQQSSLPVPDIDKLTGQYRDIDTLVEKAKRDAEHVKRTAERTKQELDGKVRRHQTRLERRREELLRKDIEQQVRLEQKAREEAAEAAREAEQKAAAIVREAERKAAELKVSLEEQEKSDQEAGRPVITKEWRRETIKDFEHDASFIRQVVMEGEVSRIERQNFTALFTEQHNWFIEKVASVEFFFDEAYNAVTAKRNNVAAVVDAQRQADDLILDLVHEYHFSAQVQAQLRLMALYEINNHMQHADANTVFLSSDVIANLVQKISIDVAPGQREVKIVLEKEKVAALQARIDQMQGRMKELEETAVNAADAVTKAADLAVVQEEIETLKKERDQILAHQAAADAKHAQDTRSLVAVVEQKQREKAELEVQLSQIAEHMRILTTRSQERLLVLAQQVTHKTVSQNELIDALEAKARRQAELEVSLAKVNEQIMHLRKTSGEVVSALTNQINIVQDRCTTVGQLLEQKQKEGAQLEVQIEELKQLNAAALDQASVNAEQAEQAQQQTYAHLAQIEQLQKAVVDLSSEKESANTQLTVFNAQVQSLIVQSQVEVKVLQDKLQAQEHELAERRKAYEQMEKLQKKLEKIRQKRELDVKHAAAHTHLLSQMAAFGDTLLVDYNRLHDAAHNAREVTKELSELLGLLRDCQQEPDHNEVIRSLNSALQLLNETSTALHNLPAPRQKILAQ